MKSKKELKQAYKSQKFRAGIVRITNLDNQRVYLKATADLDRPFNSDRFQLLSGKHVNQALQADWNQVGEAQFRFEILDELEMSETASAAEVRSELKNFLQLYQAELQAQGVLLY